MASNQHGEADLAVDLQALLVDALTAGKVQTFVDTYYLASRPRVRADDRGETFAFMKSTEETLVQAETAKHRGDAAGTIAAYKAVGDKYASEANQPHLAMFFHEKCLDIARMTGDVAAEMNALHACGLAFEAVSELEEAASRHQEHLAVARSAANGKETVTAASALVRVYSKQAQLAEGRRDPEGSLQLHVLALSAARQADDEEVEGRCSHAVGRAYVLAGQPSEGIPYLKNYLRIAKAAASEPGASSAASDNVSQAYAALAAAYQATDDHESSSQCLQELLEVANAQGNEAAQAEAAENLGLMHAHLGQRDAAQPYLTTAFELRRKLVNEGRCTRASLERVRILVGMVKGDARVAPLFSNIAAVDVKALLNWRVQRVELQDSAAAAAEQ